MSRKIIAGIDEVARGCLFGRVYCGVVIWRNDKDLNKILEKCQIDKEIIKDSKKLRKDQRNKLKNYIENLAVDYSIGWCESTEIDRINIRNATFKAMHRALDKLKITPELLLVDGNSFKKYKNIDHICIIKGDDKIQSISAASILAKVYHDDYIENLVLQEKYLERYDLCSNMGYGSQSHLKAIEQFGITKYHRKTFGICKKYC